MSTDDRHHDPGHLERLATVIGDLDSPFYDEERDRDVWNEASAVGFQLVLWGSPMVAAACVWIAGAPAVPYVIAMMLPWIVASTFTIVASTRQGVEPVPDHALKPSRAWCFATVQVVLAGGLLRAASGFDGATAADSFWRGFTGTGGVALAVGAVGLAGVFSIRARRHRAA